jgi:hypothetical protein
MYVIIPPDHAERGVVPICISDVDYEGRIVVPGWIEAVKPIADPLRKMASRITGDVRNVSQVTEEAVHGLSAKRGENFGRRPSSQVFASAKWRARNLKAGGARGRKGLEIEFRDIVIDCLAVRPKFPCEVENNDLVERLREKARELGRSDLETMIDLYLSDAEDEIPFAFGVRPNSQERNTLTRRLYRGIRSLLGSL